MVQAKQLRFEALVSAWSSGSCFGFSFLVLLVLKEISATLLLLIEVLGCREDSEGLSELSKIKLFVMLNCAPFTSKMKVSGL